MAKKNIEIEIIDREEQESGVQVRINAKVDGNSYSTTHLLNKITIPNTQYDPEDENSSVEIEVYPDDAEIIKTLKTIYGG